MAKKQDRTSTNPERANAEKQIEAIKTEIAQAMIQRNSLPKSASDEEKAAAAARVEQLQARHQEAVQLVLAIKREASTRVEQEHKEKKVRQKRLAASRRPGGDAFPNDEPAPIASRPSVHLPMDREAEEAHMDATNEEDLLLERQQVEEEEERESGIELARQRRLAQKKRKEEKAAVSREARARDEKESNAKAQASRLKAEKDARAKTRQQAALQRAEEEQAKKRQQHAERQARHRAANDAPSSGWFGEIVRKLVMYFKGNR